MIHIAIDAMGAKHGGSATGLAGILDAALNEPSISRITLFCSPPGKRLFKFPSSLKLVEMAKPWIDKNYALRVLWYEWLLGYECRKIGADVLLIAANFGRAGFGVSHVTFVRQSLPFSKEALDSFCTTRDRLISRSYSIRMMRSCRTAARVICQSSVMKTALTEAFRLDPTRVTTVYSAPKQLGLPNNPKPFPKKNEFPGDQYRLLYVGTDTPYKKLTTLVEGLKSIQSRFPSAELILTLPKNHRYASVPGVNCVSYLHNDQLADAYRSADILVLPSLVESGPQPPIEAMSLGTPVLIADRPYAHDICGDAAFFFDPLSPQDFSEKAILLLQDKVLRDSLIQKGYALIAKRREEKPYQRIIDICVEVALEARRKKGLP